MADRISSSSARRARPGDDSVGQFIIGAEIGKGSFAQVYMGRHKVSGAAVAIKSVELARLNKKLKENLYGEIKILKTLRHPHIVALHDCVESSTHINLMMEYCELGDLSLFIRKREKLLTHPATHDMARKYPSALNSGLNEVVIRHFLKQLASALKFLREGNFVHRDVKPQNLLLLPSPEYRDVNKTLTRPILTASQDSLIPAAGLLSLPMLKLADFGFARVLPSTSLAETLCGSPLYMAPEILRYERYDAKADLWSVGTVLYEMVTGRPPFRASNHVELLRKIEAAEDVIKFPRETVASSEMKSLVRALLKRSPVERLSFENFFNHGIVLNPIPGLVEDDVPKPDQRTAKDVRKEARTDDPIASPRRHSFRRYPTDQDPARGDETPGSPQEKAAPRQATETRRQQPGPESGARVGHSPKAEPVSESLPTRRPTAQPSASAPSRTVLHGERRRGASNASVSRPVGRDSPSPSSSLVANYEPSRGGDARRGGQSEEQERAAQDVAFERDYVVVEKKHVEVNAFADEMAANPRLGGMNGAPVSPKSGQMVRRQTQQGNPTSTTGAVPPAPSRAMQVAQGTQRHHGHERQGSLSGSPGSTASFITKAIQDASLRLLGIKYPAGLGKGASVSPPEFYAPYPSYPTPAPPIGLIGDGRQVTPVDEDARVVQLIEEHATRSDVVYGFAEVKYKQLVPLAPSVEHGLGGAPVADRLAAGSEEDVLTIEAVVALSEEALVLYVKALTLLAKSMDIASLWWARRSRGDQTTSSSAPSSAGAQNISLRINSAVQWVRSRFNEVLEKAEVVRLRLLEAQRRLPDDHPSHPGNHRQEAEAANSASTEGVFLTAGVTAERLMYDRAVEMSRTAAINEITNEDLAGCEISYVTAIRMLEAVLDNEGSVPKRHTSGVLGDAGSVSQEDGQVEINVDDQQSVQKLIQMIKSRLSSVRNKSRMISNASKVQQQQQSLARRRSGDVTPRSVPS
ncbi:ULK/ULK protein kinase [Gaeumannomyces tritici R3-111a-1]|uniref:non-specific serine/threonine protein kinase n=1 Tax=Gaeumannomyces tritici (strain R3-111a-1) TaxID=644352 RepID=J3P3W1_GAET3|nr:ULK/ULK protein kinase [Gaeumannomyces tritici R3-111a-1]EJT74355.1 ULK/ULK protein kinase [Gaeumannomyces tritici R3-111a-1]